MATTKIVNADQLDADLVKVANAIRTKGETSAKLAFPSGFVSAVEELNSLNFDVTRYSTEAELLAATPKENTIGIISEHDMTGWIIDANQPEELEEGMVWISVGTQLEISFNALKKNSLIVYPMSANQLIDGKLEQLPTQIYQNGKWTDLWYGQLYSYGNEWTNITGGWASKPFRIDESADYTPEAYPITKESDHMLLSANMTENTSMIICHETPIDLTEWSAIGIEYEYTGDSGISNAARLQVCNTNLDGAQIAGIDLTKGATSGTLDISKLSGEYIVGVPVWAINTSAINFKLRVILMKKGGS